ncbi:MAG TPA: amino acid ABC transporter permease [Solirubrobacterales bacterium]|nr:amino acid ABC transporter permease [Solirubrobacterales bacterium]
MSALADTFLNAEAARASSTLLRMGLVETVRLVVAVFAVSLALGAIVFWLRTGRWRPLRLLSIAYIDAVRATPPIVLLVVVYYALPAVGLPSLDVFQAGWTALGLLHGAHVGEIYRAGWLALDPGQEVAARASGLTGWQATRFVLIPQATRVALPPLTSQLTQIVRDSPLTFMVGYPELLTRAREAQNLTANSTPIVVAAALFFVLLLALQATCLWGERRARRRVAAA